MIQCYLCACCSAILLFSIWTKPQMMNIHLLEQNLIIHNWNNYNHHIFTKHYFFTIHKKICVLQQLNVVFWLLHWIQESNFQLSMLFTQKFKFIIHQIWIYKFQFKFFNAVCHYIFFYIIQRFNFIILFQNNFSVSFNINTFIFLPFSSLLNGIRTSLEDFTLLTMV